MNREAMVEALIQYYEAAGFTDYAKVLADKTDAEIEAMYNEIN